MTNKRMDMESLICKEILAMERPFKVSQLLKQLETIGITDKLLVLEILDQLCDSGLIKYSEIQNDVWAYRKTKQLV